MEMNSKPEEARPCWFVGATYDHRTDDQTRRFLQEGIWENGYQDKYLDAVKSIQIGARIAIKSAYTRKHNLPFDNRGQTVSVMAIKAIGTVKENLGDGRRLKVDWKPIDPPREWYFFTSRRTVWCVLPDNWIRDALIGFTFEEKAQDINRFRNADQWRERFGDSAIDKRRFNWIRFYEAVAEKLLAFRNRRNELVAGIHVIVSKVDGLSNLLDQSADGISAHLKDICPFTVMGLFNQGIGDANRKAIASELASLLGVSEPVPDSFEGIPILNNQKSLFFELESERQADDIEVLWEFFAKAIAFAKSDDAELRSEFVSAYDNATQIYGVGWNLTIGLYWIRPWNFLPLDRHSRLYIIKNLNINISTNGPNGLCNATDYLEILDTLEVRFQEEKFPVHSFPELSLSALRFKKNDIDTPSHPNVEGFDAQDDETNETHKEEVTTVFTESYSIDKIITDGCFISREKLEKILDRLRIKKKPDSSGASRNRKNLAGQTTGFCFDRTTRRQ